MGTENPVIVRITGDELTKFVEQLDHLVRHGILYVDFMTQDEGIKMRPEDRSWSIAHGRILNPGEVTPEESLRNPFDPYGNRERNP